MHTTPLLTNRRMGIQPRAPINKPRLPAPERVTIQQQALPQTSSVSSSSSSPQSSSPPQHTEDEAKAGAALAKLIADTAAANAGRRCSTFVDSLPATTPSASNPKKIGTDAGVGVGKKKPVGFNFSQNLPVHMRPKKRQPRQPKASRGVKMLMGSMKEVEGTGKKRSGWDKRGDSHGDGEGERERGVKRVCR